MPTRLILNEACGATVDAAFPAAEPPRLSPSAERELYFDRPSDEALEAGFWPDDPTAILTVLTGTTGVLAAWSCAAIGDEPPVLDLERSTLSGRFLVVEDENELRKLFRRLPLLPLAAVAV